FFFSHLALPTLISSLSLHDALPIYPIFVSPSNHKYDTQDYDYIDPHFGKIVNDGGAPVGEKDTDNHNASKYKLRTTNLENLEARSEEHTSELQSRFDIVCRLLLEKK